MQVIVHQWQYCSDTVENIVQGQYPINCHVFKLTNLIRSETCFMKNSKSTIDSNTRLSFQKTYVTEIGPSSYHKLTDLNIVQSLF